MTGQQFKDVIFFLEELVECYETGDDAKGRQEVISNTWEVLEELLEVSK